MSETERDGTPLVPTFQLGGVGSLFQSKSHDVFGVLQTLEAKHAAVETARRKSGGEKDAESLWKIDPVVEPDLKMKLKHKSNTGDRYRKGDNSKTNTGDGSRKGDNFKKPYSRPSHHRRNNRHCLPDYKKHPENYTCYSLGDVSTSDMSEASNTRAAFEFLEERRRMREALERGSDYEEEVKVDFGGTACSKGAFTFQKRNKLETCSGKVCGKTREATVVGMKDDEEEEGGRGMMDEEEEKARKLKDEDEEKEEDKEREIESEEKKEKTNFKSRKSRKKNLRVREETEEEDD